MGRRGKLQVSVTLRYLVDEVVEYQERKKSIFSIELLRLALSACRAANKGRQGWLPRCQQPDM